MLPASTMSHAMKFPHHRILPSHKPNMVKWVVILKIMYLPLKVFLTPKLKDLCLLQHQTNGKVSVVHGHTDLLVHKQNVWDGNQTNKLSHSTGMTVFQVKIVCV